MKNNLYMNLLLLIGFYLMFFQAVGQSSFSLQDLIQQVMEKDYGIQIVKNNVTIAENNNNIGNAGYLPRISLDARQDLTINSARQEFLSGQTNEANNARNRAFDAGMVLDWTLFDGFQMFALDKKLDALVAESKYMVQAEIEMKVHEIAVLYYTYFALKALNESIAFSIELSQERLDYISARKSKGAASDVELLQAKIDMNADSAALFDNLQEIEQIKAQLAAFIHVEKISDFDLTGGFPVSYNIIDLQEVKQKLEAQNSSILLAKSQIAIAEQEKREANGRFYPQLGVYANYNFANANNEVGFLLSNRVYGPSFGIVARWDLLDRLSRFSESKNAKVRLENAQLKEKESKQWLFAEADQAYANYKWALEKYKLEQRNIAITEDIAKIAQTSFRLGAISPFELREVQFGVIAAQQRMIQAKLSLMSAFLNLSLLSGEINLFH